jgi:hypothetical protein
VQQVKTVKIVAASTVKNPTHFYIIIGQLNKVFSVDLFIIFQICMYCFRNRLMKVLCKKSFHKVSESFE